MTDFFAAAHKAQTLHGHAKRGAWSPTYKSWRYMRDRVARDPDYAHVTISPRWNSFELFLEDMGEQPDGRTLDRVDNLKPYGPNNCKWSTTVEQANNKTTNVRLLHAGKELTVAEWARALAINPKTLYNRIYACGWSVERALTEPHRGWNKQGLLHGNRS